MRDERSDSRQAASFDASEFRAAMALLPTGVCIVTVLADDEPAGATAGAVASLSLDPPMMVACLDRGSRTLDSLREAGRFGVNVVAADREDLAHRFSTKEHPNVKWGGVEWSERAGVPWIEGTVANVACELEGLHDGGDHMIATGTVLDLEAPGGEPLIFWAGTYRGL